MRIRMVRRPSGRIDGVPLDRFEPGVVYDVNASIATYLMSMGYAQAVAEMSPARVAPPDSPVAASPAKLAAASRDSAQERARKKR